MVAHCHGRQGRISTNMMWMKRKRSRERDIERELRAHLDLEAEERREAGAGDTDARFGARRALGNSSLIGESMREVWQWAWLETLTQDLRYALRSLRGSPVFALVAISSLGFGIGANIAIFSFVNALLLKRLPVPEAAQLVQVGEYAGDKQVNSVFSLPLVDALNHQEHLFSGVLGRFSVKVNVTEQGFGEPLSGEIVTGNYFGTLRVKPALGRLMTQADIDAGGGNPVCVISYSTWQERFAGDPAVIGRRLPLNAHPYTIIGVTEKGFSGSQLHSRVDLQLPVSRMGDFMGGFFASGPGGSMWKSNRFSWLELLARLNPGVSAVEAQTAIAAIAEANRNKQVPKAEKTAFRLADGSQGPESNSEYAKPITILMGVVALVLLIACANLAGLLLARAQSRSKEFAVRLSLGASRWRLVRQLMVESAAIACGGGLVGLLLAYWIIHTLLVYLNAGRVASNLLEAAPDPLVIGFSILLSLTTAVLFGLAPSWQSARPDVLPELKGSTASNGAGGLGMRRFLIVFQIALSIVILFAAGLFTRTLSKLRTIDLGFDPARVITFSVDPAMNGYSGPAADKIFDEILGRLRALQGVSAASVAVVSPLSGAMITLDVEVPGRIKRASDEEAGFNAISPDYFRTLNQRMLSGHDFSDRDVKNARNVAIVNQLFVKQFLPPGDPIGLHFKVGGDDREIVGLVSNARYQTLREKLWPVVYAPVKQTQSSGFVILVRTAQSQQQAVAGIEYAVHAVDAKLPIADMKELQAQIDQGMSSERVLSFLASLFGALATLLCSLGIYGLIAYAVSRRTREIGIRFAIGAQKKDVAGLFLRESLLLVAAGIVAGIPLAIASTRMLKSLLFGVAPMDVTTLAWTIGIFLAAGLMASLLPLQ